MSRHPRAENQPSGLHNSCINSLAVIEYAEKTRPGSAAQILARIEDELPGVTDPRAFLSDPNNWISAQLLARLYARAKTVLADDDVARKIGFHSVTEKRLGYIQKVVLAALGGPVRALRQIQRVNDHFNRTKRVEMLETSGHSATIRLHWNGDIPLTEDFCRMNKGIYEAIPVIWGLPPAELVETECFFHGGRYCEYQLSWSKVSISRLLYRVFAPWKLAEESIREIERDKEIIRRKYEEVNALNSALNARIRQLESLHETGKALLSTLDMDVLIELVLKKLLDVAHLDRAGVFLLDETHSHLTLINAVGVEKDVLERIKGYSVPIGKKDNIIARSAREKRLVYVEDTGKTPLNPENPLIRIFQPKSFILVPLLARGETMGLLMGDRMDGKAFPFESHKEYIASFASQIAMALDNASLYRKLRESERMYREIVENSQEGIWIIDESGTIRFANGSLEHQLGRKDLAGLNVYDLIAEEGKKAFLGLIRENLNGRSGCGEIRFLSTDGGSLSALVSTVPLSQGETYEGSLVMVTDLTERKRLEARLLQAQKLEAVGTMAGGIAHDFNNILTGILGYTQLMKGKVQKDSDLFRYAEVIEKSSTRAAELIRQLLAFSRGTKPEDVGPLNLNTLISETLPLIDRFISDPRITRNIALDPDIPVIQANSTQIQQSLLNLVSNARDAMPDGGIITIRTRQVPLADLMKRYPGCHPESQRHVGFSVSDTGSGIEPEVIGKIFDPFFTTKGIGKGTGLGLAMVYGIVRNCGGHVLVESSPGAGTTFELVFPVREETAKGRYEPVAGETRGGTETILVVDDEDMIRDLAFEILSSNGYKVLTAKDGLDAFHTFASIGPSAVDLVLMDIVMPRLDGIEAYSKIRALKPTQKVLFSSGFTSQSKAVGELKEKGVPFIGKPYRDEELLRKVRDTLNADPVLIQDERLS